MRFFILCLVILPLSIFGQHDHQQMPGELKPVVLDSGLGKIDHPVSTTKPLAKKFFNQGLAYLYAFNHEEAIRSFKRAAELDPNFAMAYWGIALGLGSNYNLTAEAEQLKEAYLNLQKALALAPRASELESAYIAALSKRYAPDPATDRQKLAEDYKMAMGELVKKYPDDLDAATLYAESMMNLRPWQLWTQDGKPADGTLEIIAVLEGILKRNPNHIGANHYYIHAVEASMNPERAVPSAMRLAFLAPSAGHLVHMPSHVYIRTGDYVKAAKANADAIIADRNFIKKTGVQGVYTMMYYNHNIHFLSSASSMNGNYAEAIKTARELEANVRPLVKIMPMLEMFSPYPLVTLVRFQKWNQVMQYPQPGTDLKIVNCFWHFARGMAFAGKGNASGAETELTAFGEKMNSISPETIFGNGTAHGVLTVAENLLSGQIAMVKGDKKSAIDFFGKAVAASDLVNYNEPPDWDLPVREWLGRAHLKNGEYTEAEKVYRAELVKHPHNGRALFGLAESLRKQGKADSARIVRREFQESWKKADTILTIRSLYQ